MNLDAGRAAYERQDYATALREFRPLAEQGDAMAQNFLGVMYKQGQGVAQDDQAAMQWWRKAAEQGNIYAKTFLGFMCKNGHGQGMPQNDKAAGQLLSKTAQQGDADAQYHLGVMYYLGQDVAQDYQAARQWWCKAAEQGSVYAQYSLGGMYYNGEGVPKDTIRAYMWANLAVSNGANTDLRDEIAEEMTTADIEKAQSLARDCLAKNYETNIQAYLKANQKSKLIGFLLALCFSTLGLLYSNKKAGSISTAIMLPCAYFMPDKIYIAIGLLGWILSMAFSFKCVNDANARLEAKVRFFNP